MLEMISFRLWSTCKDYLLALILAIWKDTDKFIVHFNVTVIFSLNMLERRCILDEM